MAGTNRRATAASTVRQTLRASRGKLGGFDLPEGVLPKGKEWHPRTVAWWEEWRRSPQAAAMITGPDWQYLLDTALLHHQYWSNGRWEFANELRMREAKLGATPKDRADLKFEVDTSERYPVGHDHPAKPPQAGGGTMTPERRLRLIGG